MEPINYYGFTKLEIERILKWYGELKGLKFAALRSWKYNKIESRRLNTKR